MWAVVEIMGPAFAELVDDDDDDRDEDDQDETW